METGQLGLSGAGQIPQATCLADLLTIIRMSNGGMTRSEQALDLEHGKRVDSFSTEKRIDCFLRRYRYKKSGQADNLRYNPPPSPDSCSCGGKLTQRKKATAEVAREGYDENLAKTAPLVDDYGALSSMKSANGVVSLLEVNSRAKKGIGAA